MRRSRPISLTETQAARFWSNVAKGESDTCWVWKLATNNKGYGQSHFGLPHRVAYWLTHGDFDWSLLICHKCDNPPCCNPAHLFLGTHTDNMHDMIAKGRDVHGGGEGHARALLTEANVAEIRRSTESHSALAIRFGVSVSAVAQASSGVNWKHLAVPPRRRMLTKETVLAIRAANGKTGRDIAREFAVSEGLVSMIRNRRIWRNV